MTPEQRNELDWSEHAVINSILRDNSNAHLIDLRQDEFQIGVNGQVYGMMRELLGNGFPVEPVGLIEALEARYHKPFAPLIDVIMNDSLVPSDPTRYCDVIRNRSQVRVGKHIGQRLAETGDIQEALKGLHSLSASEQRFLHGQETLLAQTIAELQEGRAQGIQTGFERYDGRFGGLHPGDLIVIGARPAVGKTALMLNIMVNAKVPTLVVSGEQPARQCQARLFASVGKIPFERIRLANLTLDDWDRVGRAKKKLAEVPYWIFDKSAPSLADVHREARKAHQAGAKLVMVDYLQRMKREGDRPRHEQVGDCIQGLKELARDLSIPVVCLAQVNREVDKRENKMPTMADLKDSGTIEQEADVIALMYRERAYNPRSMSQQAELYVAKNRHGPTGSIDLHYAEEFLRFENVERVYG